MEKLVVLVIQLDADSVETCRRLLLDDNSGFLHSELKLTRGGLGVLEHHHVSVGVGELNLLGAEEELEIKT